MKVDKDSKRNSKYEEQVEEINSPHILVQNFLQSLDVALMPIDIEINDSDYNDKEDNIQLNLIKDNQNNKGYIDITYNLPKVIDNICCINKIRSFTASKDESSSYSKLSPFSPEQNKHLAIQKNVLSFTTKTMQFFSQVKSIK